MHTTKSFCRICQTFCAIEVDVEDGRVMAVRGDRADPMTQGFLCIKGSQIPYQMNEGSRLQASQRRLPGGGFEPVSTARAIEEIATRLARIRTVHGPRAIATYCGTYGWFNSASVPIMRAWHDGLGSPSYYSSLTIDRPARFVAAGRMGMWGGGVHSFQSADVLIAAGINPLVSCGTASGGIPPYRAAANLAEAKRRGLKLICVDPLRTETAKRADIHLQIAPGEDATLFAGMLRLILEERLHDVAFCAEWVAGLDELHAAVSDFTPDYVARRCGVPADQVVAAARLFARGPRGCATTGVGTEMSPGARLTEFLVLALNVVCGRVNRVGERVGDPGALGPAVPRYAAGIPPEHLPPLCSFGRGAQPRVRGLSSVCGEMPAGALADEILTPGEGQVRALICVGGNPLMAFPDQLKTKRAFEQLDLLVCLDPFLSATAQLAHFSIAPKLPLEREDMTALNDYAYERPYAHYTPAVVPTDLDVIEEWEFFLALAARMDVPMHIRGTPIDSARPPSKYELLQQLTAGSRVPLDRVRAHDGGAVFDDVDVVVKAPPPGFGTRLRVAPAEIVAMLRALRCDEFPEAGAAQEARQYSHRLICSRLREVLNSVCHDFPRSRARRPTNPAFMSPGDMVALGVRAGDRIVLSSDHGAIHAIAEEEEGLRAGVIAMAHSWGATEPGADVRQVGASVNRLVADDRHYDPVTGMPRQSSIPVNIRKA